MVVGLALRKTNYQVAKRGEVEKMSAALEIEKTEKIEKMPGDPEIERLFQLSLLSRPPKL